MAEEAIPHELLDLINRKGEVRVDQAAEILKVDVKTLMDMSKMLIEARILEVVYTVAGEVKLKPGREFKKALEDETTTNTPAAVAKNETATPTGRNPLNEFLELVKKKISEKRLAKPRQKK